MNIFVIHFGNSSRFNAILKAWHTHYLKSGCALPAGLLTDYETAIPDEWVEWPFISVRPAEQCRRPGNPFDYKSAIICAALPILPAPCIIIDSDAVFLGDPTDELLRFTNQKFIVAEDAGRRKITMPEGSIILEQSSSVMLFGGRLTDKDRQELIEDFRRSWHHLEKFDSPTGLVSDIREQRAWSMVNHFVNGGRTLPRCLNWSRFWSKTPPDDAKILHYHGPSKDLLIK